MWEGRKIRLIVSLRSEEKGEGTGGHLKKSLPLKSARKEKKGKGEKRNPSEIESGERRGCFLPSAVHRGKEMKGKRKKGLLQCAFIGKKKRK